MPKQPQAPYFPSNVPNDPETLPTFLYDELYRIAEAINAPPEGFSVTEEGSIQFTTGVVEDTQLFLGATPGFDVPGGGWDPTTGEWTAQVNGLYTLSGIIEIDPIGGGNKDYVASLVLYKNGVEEFRSSFAQQDDYKLTSIMAFAYPFAAGDVFKLHCETYSELQTSLTPYYAYWTMVSTA